MPQHRWDDAILIAGGGIGGLSLAIALARQGRSTHILERSDAFSEAGAGIQLGPNATRILQDWGVMDVLAPDLVSPESLSVFDGLMGLRLATVPLGETAEKIYGAPYCTIHRADLQKGLLATARSCAQIRITTGFELTRYVRTREGVSAHARTGEVARGQALVAADGITSRVRKQLNPDANLRFSGKSAWRTLIQPTAVPGLGPRPRSALWLAPNAHLVHYPVRGGREINVVAVIEDRWKREGWNTKADAAELLPHYESWAQPAQAALRAARDWRKWALFELSPLTRWVDGNVALLGDAAHPMLPFLAQGGVMAIEDAATLARELTRADMTIEAAFRRYESLRKPRATRVQGASERNGRIYHLSGPARWSRNFVLRRHRPEALLRRLDWLYGFVLGAV